MATPVSVREGHPNNWPRKIARKHLFALDAVLALREKMDDSNEKFALIEFTEEREKMARSRIRKGLLVRGEADGTSFILLTKAELDEICPEEE